MKRREFVSRLGVAAGAAAGVMTAGVPAAASAAADAPIDAAQGTQSARANRQSSARPKARMVVGCQRSPTTATMLDFFKRHAVEHINGYPPAGEDEGSGYSADSLKRLRGECEKHGVSLDMVQFPFMSSSHVDRAKRRAIMMGEDPARQQEIDECHAIIKNCAAAGIPAIKYNLSVLGVLRTESTPGRGGSINSTWKLAAAKDGEKLTRAGVIDADRHWERITYFLERVVPVAEEYKIRLACHPHDPGVPPKGFRGVNRVLGTVEGLKRFVEIKASPYHGLNLCLGTTAEMLQQPATEIHDVIRYFGERKKIFNIHFRNIKGKRDDFHETFPDEGDMDMVAVMMTLRDVDYPYMVMPDHMPRHPDDQGQHQAFAFGYGYIKALIQAVDRLTT
jgi:mannonate dehydratase